MGVGCLAGGDFHFDELGCGGRIEGFGSKGKARELSLHVGSGGGHVVVQIEAREARRVPPLARWARRERGVERVGPLWVGDAKVPASDWRGEHGQATRLKSKLFLVV